MHGIAHGQEGWPVEINERVLILNLADSRLVQRRPTDSHFRRGPIPVQQSRTLTRGVGVQQICVFKPATIAGEFQEGHGVRMVPEKVA